MYKFEMQKACDKLINEIFCVKPGETVIITMDTLSNETLSNAVASSAYTAGAKPMVINMAAPDGVGKAADPDLPIEALTAALSNTDVWIEFNERWLLYSTPFERAMEANDKLRYMCLVGFTPELLIRTVGNVDTKPLQIFMDSAQKKHMDAKHIRVTTPAGTDVEFECDPTHTVASDCGRASVPGFHMMTGQLNVIPKFGTVNGTIVFDGTITPPFGNVPATPVKLTVKNSKIVKIEGGHEAAEYDKYLNDFNDEGMLKMAHMAYGFNPGAKLTGNVVEDERVWGCTEWGIGYVSAIEAPPIGQPAVSHSDGICLNSSVWIDDVQFMNEGKIVDPELYKISPIK